MRQKIDATKIIIQLSFLGQKALRKEEKMLVIMVTGIFSFSHKVFKHLPKVIQTQDCVAKG